MSRNDLRPTRTDFVSNIENEVDCQLNGRASRVLDPNASCGITSPRVTARILTLLLTVSVLWGTRFVSAQQASQTSTETKQDSGTIVMQPKTDALGDPLPAGALLRLGTKRFRPPSGVHELVLSPDGKVIVTVGGRLIVWDAATGQELWRAPANQFTYESNAAAYCTRPLAFSADNSKFYTLNEPGQIAVWDLTTRGLEKVMLKFEKADSKKLMGGPKSIDVAADGKTFAIGFSDGIAVCHRDGKVIHQIANTADSPLEDQGGDRLTFGGHYSYARIAPNAAEFAVVTSEHPRTIRIHDIETGAELRKIPLSANLVRLAYSPDGKQIVATERDNAVRLYDVKSGACHWSHIIRLNNPFENYTSTVAFSPDGKTIVAGATDHLLHLLEPSTGTEIGQLKGTHWYPWTVAFTADSKMLYSAGWDGTIRRWDVVRQKQLPLPQGVHASEVVDASPDGKMLAYQDDGGAVRLISSRIGTELRQIELPGMRFSQLKFSPDSQFLAGGGSNGDQVQVAVWRVQTGERIQLWSWPKGKDPHSQVESLCFTPDGSRLAAAVFRQSACYIWDLERGQQTAVLKHKEVYGLSFSPSGETLATAGWDSIVRFWDSESGKLRREFQVSTEKEQNNGIILGRARDPEQKVDLNHRVGDLRMYSIGYAPEGGLIATAHMDGEIWVWEANDMQPQMMIWMGNRLSYDAMKFSPDGLWVATGASSGTVQLWDPLTGKKVWDCGRHDDNVYNVGFGRNNRTLVSGSDDGLCYQWDLRPPKLHQHQDNLPKLWEELAGEESAAAYRAMWALSDATERAVDLIAEKLRPVKTLVDPDRLAAGNSDAENQRLGRMKRLLAAKDPKVELNIVARRAIAVLEQIETRSARELLEELVKRDPESDLGRFAKAALSRRRSGE